MSGSSVPSLTFAISKNHTSARSVLSTSVRYCNFLTVHIVLAILFSFAPSIAMGNSATADPAKSETPLESVLKNRSANLTAPLFKALSRFYSAREFRPVWMGTRAPNSKSNALLEVLNRSGEHALPPTSYGTESLATRIAAARKSPLSRQEAAELEAYLSLAFLAYAVDMTQGRIAPEKVDAAWEATPRTGRLHAALRDAAEDGPAEAIQSLIPRDPAYRKLQDAFARYAEISRSNEWSALTDIPLIRAGDKLTTRVYRQLANRLAAEGYLEDVKGDSVYAGALIDAVQKFQRQHGIKVDGTVGPNTLKELNVPARDRAKQIGLNLERWRWLPIKLEPTHIRVNVPAFELTVFRSRKPTLRMATVVGKIKFETPLFSDEIDKVVINPYWHVPNSIARDEIIPKLRESPDYLEQNNMVLLAGWRNDERMDESKIDWKSLDPADFEHRFRQEPGPRNALGLVKFIFPNQFSVYLHDTPSDHLFNRIDRAFSHGCIRVERPKDLARELLREEGWNLKQISETIKEGQREEIDLQEPVPVHIVYWTAFVNEDGGVEFHQDIYGIDRSLAELFNPLDGGA